MRTLRSLNLREFLAPLLAILIALAGIAGARASGEQASDPLAHVALCLPAAGGGQASDHDCADCTLPAPSALPAALQTEPAAARFAMTARFNPAPPALRSGAATLPWPRGPPGAA